jgi:hypothetical protein
MNPDTRVSVHALTQTSAIDPPRLASRYQSLILALFGCSIFMAASLVFLVQPMAAKMVLPLFGGSSSVWTASMVFFQSVLLGGYLYAHGTTRTLGLRRHLSLHSALLLASVAALPIGQHLVAPEADSSPTLSLLGLLALSVGVPFFVVTTASPLLQRWFYATGHTAGRDPYFLYATGNAGSLLALLAYPLVVEPRLSLDAQTQLWSAGYVGFVLLCLGCAFLLWRSGAPGERGSGGPARALAKDQTLPHLAWKTRLRWVFMAFVPSSLMLGTTSYISTDLAAVPLLWVIPLAVYLLTFIIAFARKPPIRVGHASWGLALLAPVLVMDLLGVLDLPIWALIVLHVATLFFAGALAHGRLAAERPAPERLTDFYVMLSLGGVLGGIFNALLAPHLFDSLLEYPLAIVLVLLLRPALKRPEKTSRYGWTADFLAPLGLLIAVLVALAATGRWIAPELVLGVSAGMLLVFYARPIRFALGVGALLALLAAAEHSGTLYADRTFFGVLRVTENDQGQRLLAHGTTLHGLENFKLGQPGEPQTYFARTGPLGDVFGRLQNNARFERVEVIGLGVGTIAAYGEPGQTITFYEIDPGVVEIASDRHLFTYLSRSKAKVKVVLGDGRLSISETPDAMSDLIVIDAFSSDAIPAHLLTREAVELYIKKLQPEGIVAFNISNRYLDLAPVLAAVAEDLGLEGVEREDLSVSDQEGDLGKKQSRWIVLARKESRLRPLDGHGWKPLRASSDSSVWTDDFSNVLSVIDWSR